LVRRDDFMVSLDLWKGCFHFKIHPDFRTFFGIEYPKNSFYIYNVLPFGWTNSPYYFQKLTQPFVRWLRERGVQLLHYIDDFLFLHQSHLILAWQLAHMILPTMEKLQLLVKKEKCNLIPTQILDFIGFVINSVTMVISIPQRKVLKACEWLEALISNKTVQRRMLAKIAGLLISFQPAIFLARTMSQRILFTLDLAYKSSSSWEDLISLDTQTIMDAKILKSWIHSWNGTSFNKSVQLFQVATDASNFTWGAEVLNYNLVAHGQWPLNLIPLRIEWKELMAVLLTLETFSKFLQKKRVQILINNTVAKSYIKKGGGRVMSLYLVARDIRKFCLFNNIYLENPIYIPTEINPANFPSRIINVHDWEIATSTFSMLNSRHTPSTGLPAT